MLAQLQKLDALSQLSGGLAHDLNNVLGIIIGNLTEFQCLPPEQRASTNNVGEALSAEIRGAEHVSSLLAFARKKSVSTQNHLDLDQHLEELLSVIRFVVGVRIAVETDLDAKGATLRIDQAGLDNSLLNLVLNARDAMPDGGRLTIRTRPPRTLSASECEYLGLAAGTTRYAEVCIEDSGLGMNASVLSHALEPYFTTKGGGQGTGLGLPMVHSFVQQHAGGLRLESEEGNGTRVILYIPAMDAVPLPSKPLQPQAKSPLRERIARPLRVLVVDDEVQLLKLSERILVRRGHEVLIALNAEEAKARLDSGESIESCSPTS